MPSNSNKDYYYIIRDTSPAESVLIEYAFLDSNKDDKKQIRNDWEKWAEAVVKAVAEYKGYNYVKPGQNTVNGIYKVQKGDSLWSIAKKFNVGINEIKSANNLTSNLISVGQELVIPGFAPPEQTNITYVVQKGDSLWSIANANNTTVDEIVNLNDLVNNTIYVGQILQIPNSGNSSNVPDSETIYIVEKGDTLYSIAQKYDTTIDAIIRKNGLTNDDLVVGQSLIIPADVESTGKDEDQDLNKNLHVVQKGESLFSIASKYNVPISKLREVNKLMTDLLTIGQVLIIPDSSDSSNLYVVQKGDSLWSISNKFGVSINSIRVVNNLSSDILTVGQTLIIP